MTRIRPLPILVAVLIVAVSALALRVAALDGGETRTPLTTAFTYQGRALNAGQPANGLCDIRFGLFDDLVAGSAVGPTVEHTGVQVTDGLFSVRLDFGSAAFTDPEQRYLAVELRCPAGAGNYVLLSPRHELTATPFALYALNAGTAQQVPWSGITGVPSDLGGPDWQNVIVVAKSGGDFTSIQAALDSVTGATTANRFLVWVAPGVYEERVSVPPFVSIRGAGRKLVTIRSGGAASSAQSATVTLPPNTGLSGVHIENTGFVDLGSGAFSKGVRLTSGGSGVEPDVFLEDVSVHCLATGNCVGLEAQGAYFEAVNLTILVYTPFPAVATEHAIGVLLGGTPGTYGNFRNVDVYAERFSGTTQAVGVRVDPGSALTLDGGQVRANSGYSAVAFSFLATGFNDIRNIYFEAFGGNTAVTAIGILVSAGGGQINARSVSVRVGGAPNPVGISLIASRADLRDIRVEATSQTFGAAVGLEYSGGVQVTLRDSTIGSGGLPVGTGIAPFGTDTSPSYLHIVGSSIASQSSSVKANANQVVRIADSQLDSRSGAGSFTCIGTYNQFFAPFIC